METTTIVKAHFESIEPVIVKLISEANESIFIVMAWLTSDVVKRALLRAKRRNSNLQVEIVVDDNETNDRFFLNTQEEFKQADILIKKKVDGRFLHRKFMVVDQIFTLLGSYNYTRKAKRNAENIALIKNGNFSAIHQRVFQAMTDLNYRDENVQLLFDHPSFAQRLLSSYYPFTRQQYKLYKLKIVNGDCFTHENGLYDEMEYEPGLIFNKCCWMNRKLDCEFTLPINKEMVKNWTGNRNENLLIDDYRDSPEFWDELSEQIEKNWDAIDVFFQAIFDTTYTYVELRTMIIDEVDIIIEDRLWPDNFALFLNDQLIDELFAKFPTVNNGYSGHEILSAFKKTKKKSKRTDEINPFAAGQASTP